MATYSTHWRVIVSGVLGTFAAPVEIFSYGFAIGNEGLVAPTVQPLPGSAITQLVGAVEDFHGSPDMNIGTNAVVTKITVAGIDSTGHYAYEPQEVATNKPGGVSSGVSHPYQSSVCVSLWGTPQLRRRKGRFYLPAPRVSINPDTGLITEAQVSAMASRAANFLGAVNVIIGGLSLSPTVIVAGAASGVDVTPSRPADNSKVVECRVGNVVDTQRRRRNALVETYQVRTVGTP